MNDLELTEKVNNHEERIGKLEIKSAVTDSKLDITNKILGAIAIMIGGSIVSYIFHLIFSI